MAFDATLTTWKGCPQSRLCQEVVARRDRAVADAMWQVAQEWDRIMAPNRLLRWIHERFGPRRFSPGEYGAVTRAVSSDALQATLHYITELRRRDRVRANLRAVAFLERFETAVAHELDRRSPQLPREWGVASGAGASWEQPAEI